MDKHIRMRWLVDEINKHNENYYVLDNPTISDAEWDKLYDELVLLENSLNFVLPDSPTQQVGGQVLAKFKKFVHKTPLYSLNKVTTFEGLHKWTDSVERESGKKEYTVECKLDGLNMTLTYNNGVLQSAATRGDGAVGEDVTLQVLQIANVPKTISFKGELVVQGEAVMKLSVLQEYNKTAIEPLKNARNAAAGAIRNLDPEVVKQRKLDVYFYNVSYIENTSFNTQIEMFEFLKQNGFENYDYLKLAQSEEELEKYVAEIDELKNNSDVLLDGAVIKLNNIALRDEIGFTAKFPKWAVAYKFEAQELTSKLVNVAWQVGRTGKITPVAEIEPVELAGALVKHATLNNYGDIERKQLMLNSSVFVRRSNEVIPEILGVAEHNKNSVQIVKPTNCPSCGSVLEEEGANLFCRNSQNCKEQVVSFLVHFVNKRAFNVAGLNEKILLQLLINNKIKKAYDIFLLTEQDLVGLEGFKDKKINNLIDSINKSKQISLHSFIYSLGISAVGEKTAKDLSRHFKTLQNLMSATIEELVQVPEVGEIIAQNIYNWFADENNIEFVNRLLSLGVKLQEESVILQNIADSVAKQKFFGKTVVITGRIEGFSRDELKDTLESLGAIVTNSVSKKTDYLIVGEDGGSKLDRAIALGVEQVDGNDFVKLLNN